MSILSTSPQTEIAVRNKRNSDLNELLNKGLTIENNRQQSSHGLAAASNRDTKMELEITTLSGRRTRIILKSYSRRLING